MGIARYQQSFGLRQAYVRPTPPVAAAHHELEEASPSSNLSQVPFDNLTPGQGEILLRERIGRLSGTWKRLPHRQADALALHYFGGLTLAEVGVVLGIGAAEVEAMFSHQAPIEAQLFDIAADLHPSKELTAWLTLQVKEAAASTARRAAVGARLVGWIKADIWRVAFRLRSILIIGSRVAQAGLLVGILAGGLYIIQRQSIIPPQAQLTPTAVIIQNSYRSGGCFSLDCGCHAASRRERLPGVAAES